MSRVEIKTPDGHQVVIEHEGELEPIKRTALELFEATKPGSQPAGRGMGFQVIDRRGTAPVASSSMWRPPHPYPIQFGPDAG